MTLEGVVFIFLSKPFQQVHPEQNEWNAIFPIVSSSCNTGALKISFEKRISKI